jgi:hypothetical protein
MSREFITLLGGVAAWPLDDDTERWIVRSVDIEIRAPRGFAFNPEKAP